MLVLLSKYLLQYKRVCIPGIGTFEIVAQPSQLNVADKLISSPVYITRHRKEEELPDHQLHFLANNVIKSESFREELLSFGEQLKRRIRRSAFHWRGFGTLRYDANELIFEPEEIRPEAFQPVPARKVLRENVQHQVLVGDQEMTAQQVSKALTREKHKRPWFIIAGWILLLVAFVAAILFLYMKNFQTSSTGLQTTW